MVDRSDRQIFTPAPMPTTGDAALMHRWHVEQWRRLGNYIQALEGYVAELEARIEALEP
ncbi:hypothetical protein [Qingshengfaniella alkalisoli]|uniref:hypothetical protein n=1 Tax=Qingshengfaniella alkalisoli TaxID=2599296 RepID=UPI00143D42ED|nr:hypothetical protein [Qingshengfaniella alkalisoli]